KLTQRFREQARSHRDLCCTQIPVAAEDQCGSGLAREGVITFNIDASCPTAFASKPTPTGVAVNLLP
ncbi:hypothetical protein RL74_26065, partial [Pseudomonas fluorescens]